MRASVIRWFLSILVIVLIWPAGAPAAPVNIATISVGPRGDHSLALSQDGKLWAWGRNEEGELGLGDNISRNKPTRVGRQADWVTIAAGSTHSLGIRADGILRAWGAGDSGQLGNAGEVYNHYTPTKLKYYSNWTAVAAGDRHSLGLISGSSLYAWGDNNYGQTGDPSLPIDTDPHPRGDGWQTIAAGGLHSLMIKNDGSLWAMGRDNYGQLGLGGGWTAVGIVYHLGEGTDWTAVAGGYSHSLALKTNDSLWVWGWNQNGQLGLGDPTTDKDTPTQVDGAWIAVAGGEGHTLGIKADHSLWAWGANTFGQLGLGDTTEQHTPMRVGQDSDWVAVAAGVGHSLGLKTDGTLWAWGDNGAGQLGLGDNTGRYVPTQVTEFVTESVANVAPLKMLLLD